MKNKLEAVIFDIDGLILDYELFYAQAWVDAFNLITPKDFRYCESKSV